MSTDGKESGVYAWMASVRASMDNDSSRQIFENQVQSHAFLFLENYLEHILAGPKQGPMIDLVKTPGPKKNVPRRTRAATAAVVTVKNNTPFSLDDDESTNNVVPVNSFHKALLQAKGRSVQDAVDPRKFPIDSPSTSDGLAERTRSGSMSAQVADIPEITISVEPESKADAMPLQHYPRIPQSESFPASEHGAQLSVIAEGDESPERSHVNILPLSTIASRRDEPLDSVPRFPNEGQKYPVSEGIIETDHESQECPSPDASAPPPIDVYHHNPPSEAPTGNHTHPLPSRNAINSPKSRERNAFTAPLPTVPVSNSIPTPRTISVPLNDTSPRSLAHKSGAAGFPMLPAPSPLRKSVRVAQDVIINSVLPTTAPLPMPLGKRTSWLMKAREAKAKEGTSSLPGTSVTVTSTVPPRVSIAVKRKSGEMLGTFPPGSDLDKDQRKPKVAKSTEIGIVPLISQETEKTTQRDFHSVHIEPIALPSATTAMSVEQSESHAMDVDKQITHLDFAEEEGYIDLFKRTVEGLGARAGKSTGKSLGGAAVAALAEARAAAEARVAERNKVSSETGDSEALRDGLPDPETRAHSNKTNSIISAPQERTERRFSISDLVPDTLRPNQPKLSATAAQVTDVGARINSGDESLSTTPHASPPSKGTAFVKPAGPVFNKPPPPVFMPPAAKQSSTAFEHSKELSKFPSSQLTLPAAVYLGIPARLTTTSDSLPPLVQGTSKMSAQSQSSTLSDPIFDKRDGFSTIDSQLRDPQPATIEDDDDDEVVVDDDDDDDDDSWPLEDKLAAAEPGWRPFDFSNVDKEDTWSSLPTESQEPTRSLDTVPLSNVMGVEAGTKNQGAKREQEQDTAEISDTERSVMDTDELEEVAEVPIAKLGSPNPEPIARATSQTSIASTASSSQSQTGFFGQATKLVNSMLGGGKKGKPELKSLQLAAAAAKKQQEEADKKVQRLKDMETRRQVAIAKKVEEERTRLLEEEKRNKEELEKRKREREENTDRRPLKLPVSTKKVEDDAPKKRKLASETEKRLESKKPPSKDKKDPAPPTKSAVTPATKLAASKAAKATAALVSSTAYNATQNPKPFVPEAKPFKVVPSALKGKAKAKPQDEDMDDRLPSTMVQSQMAARAKAQIQASKVPTPEVPSESIELPDINSEYSDSEDEGRVRAFNPPDWAQSPELRQALEMQSTVNPDDIFGEIRPLRMEEVFRTRQSRFRARTSSANWSGSDRLTVEEIREYERRMGFQQTRA